MISKVLKRDGSLADYDSKKIEEAIFKAVKACGGTDRSRLPGYVKQVEVEVVKKCGDRTPLVEEIQDAVEKVLIENQCAQVAKAYILYREKRKTARENNALVGATINMFDQYLGEADWKVKENANATYSVAGLNQYVREKFTAQYWLNEIYPTRIGEAHRSGALHVHDLGFYGAYCVGWDLKQLLMLGFTGVPGKPSSKPAKHLRSFLGQVVNYTFTTQGETAGAQAWSSFDTYCAPFIRYDKLNFNQVKQCIQEFIFNMNISTRVGFQCPFSNITLDLKCPHTLKDQAVILGGVPQDTTYGEYQKEMDMINKALCEVFIEGDSQGRVFTFPIPTINITKDLDWDSEVVNDYMNITAKYGIPYFANFVNSDLSAEDAVSMCCRLRLNVKELRKKGGGLFGSNPLTGSIGVVTLNLPRIGYLAKTEKEIFDSIKHLCDIAKESLEIKRKVVEENTDRGLYPYCKFYLSDVKRRTGNYWGNHFSTIGVVGMNELLLNYMGKDITTKEGQAFAIKIMQYMREILEGYQEETGHQYNLEATPAEGTSARLASIDKKRFPEIIAQGTKSFYYTNSTQLPVDFTEDIFKAVDLQDELQNLYTGGTVLHLYLGERIESGEVVKDIIKKIFNNYKLPYISFTPTFSVCEDHGYISGEHFTCPECGKDCEVWSRVVGYIRNVQNFNNAKKEEYFERRKFCIERSCFITPLMQQSLLDQSVNDTLAHPDDCKCGMCKPLSESESIQNARIISGMEKDPNAVELK